MKGEMGHSDSGSGSGVGDSLRFFLHLWSGHQNFSVWKPSAEPTHITDDVQVGGLTHGPTENCRQFPGQSTAEVPAQHSGS